MADNIPVLLYRNNQVVDWQATKQGNFSFTNLPGGTYHISVQKPGHLMFNDPDIVIDSDSVSTDSVMVNIRQNDILVTLLHKTVLPQDITFFPNPAKDLITIDCKTFVSLNVKLKMLNAAGQVVYAYTATKPAGSSYLNVKLPTLSTGIYLLMINNGNKNQWFKLKNREVTTGTMAKIIFLATTMNLIGQGLSRILLWGLPNIYGATKKLTIFRACLIWLTLAAGIESAKADPIEYDTVTNAYYYAWDDYNQVWQPESWQQQFFLNNLLVESETSIWSKDYYWFVEEKRTVFVYNKQGLLEQETMFRYNLDFSAWINASRKSYAYNQDNLLEKTMYYQYLGDTTSDQANSNEYWALLSEEVYAYNGNLLNSITFNTFTDVDNSYLYEITYPQTNQETRKVLLARQADKSMEPE
ncbi:MAG: T9SS type A sorting domain-containing protein [Bacteroidales bacterium]|nr:T9SS type A sorting domain-containing protein [Bacteroidales bacterium]